ncbi:MAG TPA: hypothetical protein VFA66_05290 [Gaiellaceae bacterium]|nr:hypothetical protein [Gaiellaceae bacterium]
MSIRSISAVVVLVVVGAASGGAYALSARSSSTSKPKIRQGPSGATSQTKATFRFTRAYEADFYCSLDADPSAPCGAGTSGEQTYAGLADGAHTFRVEARVGTATSKPAKRVWTVDTMPPPAPSFTRSPPSYTRQTKVQLTYKDAEAGVTFRCSLDGNAYRGCRRSQRYRRLAPTSHSFCVRAVDRAGNESSPECLGWTVGGETVGFSVSGAPLPGVLLYPGGPAVPVNLVFTNPSGFPITIQQVRVSVQGTSASGCGSSGFLVSSQLAATPTVPGDATASLQDLGVPLVDWPQLRMVDRGNQDACKGATVALAYSGTATG